MSDQLRELVRPFGDVEPPLDLRARISQREALVAGRRPPLRIPRMMVVAAATVGVVLVIGALALAAHSRSTAPRNEGSNTKVRPDTQAQLDSFLHLLAPRVSQVQSHITLARQNLELAANSSARAGLPPSTSMGNQLWHITEDIEGPVYASLTAVTPPRGLTVAWSDFKVGVKETARTIRVAQFTVQENKLPYTRNTRRAYFRHLEAPIIRLKAALAAYAARHHFSLPAWVDRLGK